ncbi:MAG: hypothetical protein IK031_07470 [Bacteroidales bacterium]|nr:hypothetical protein [Bacteroidales bacterium]
MKKAFILAALAAAALAVSCQVKEAVIDTPENDPAEVDAPVMRTFTCVFAQPTKVQIDGEKGSENLGKTTWEENDQILVHTGHISSTQSTVITLKASDISADGKKATITVPDLEVYDWVAKGWTTDPDKYSDYYAAYPAAATSNPSSCYDKNYFSDTNKPLLSAYSDGDTFVFYNLTSIITFSVSGDFDSYIFSGNNKEIVAYDTYAVELLKGTQNFLHSKSSGEKTTISGTLTPGTNFIHIPNGADFTDGFSFKFLKGDNVVKTATTSTSVNVSRSKILALGDITAKLEDYSAPTPHESEIPIAGAIDLSADGTANCYMLSAPGTYKLPAVMGNTSKSQAENFLNVSGVELLWETYNNDQAVTKNSVISAVDFEDNWIYFTTPEALKPGNALIAAKNSLGRIIWSWHIWIPASTVNKGSYNLMDRNLGALYPQGNEALNALSFGLAYQWGRKDPFPGSGSTDSSDGATIASDYSISVTHDNSAPKGSISLSIQNPMVIYNTNDTDWNDTRNGSLWNAGSGAKTVYDPCPAGYKVPDATDAPVVFASNLMSSEGWVKDDTNKIFQIGNPALIFPLSGYLDDYENSFTYSKIGKRTVIWASKEYDLKRGCAIDVRFDTNEGAGSATYSKAVKSRLGSVRCVVE